MTASSSVLSLSNRALLQIGARAQIASLTEGSTESDAINVLWLPTYEALARTAPWNCLTQQATLTLIAAAQGTPENPSGTSLPLPPTPWLYQYQTPSDNLQIRYLVPSQTNSTPTGTVPLTSVNNLALSWYPGAYEIPFKVAFAKDAQNNPIEVVLTNLSQAQVVYTVNSPNPTIFDSLFEQAFVSSLAAFLSPALTLNLPLMKMAIATAEAAIAQARVRDGDEGLTSQNHTPDWMRARMVGSLYNYTAGQLPWNAFNNMLWPAA